MTHSAPERPTPDGDLYIIIRGGLVVNEPAIPVIDLDVLETDFPDAHDAKYAREQADVARQLGLADIADELDQFAAQLEEVHDGR